MKLNIGAKSTCWNNNVNYSRSFAFILSWWSRDGLISCLSRSGVNNNVASTKRWKSFNNIDGLARHVIGADCATIVKWRLASIAQVCLDMLSLSVLVEISPYHLQNIFGETTNESHHSLQTEPSEIILSTWRFLLSHVCSGLRSSDLVCKSCWSWIWTLFWSRYIYVLEKCERLRWSISTDPSITIEYNGVMPSVAKDWSTCLGLMIVALCQHHLEVTGVPVGV